MISITLKKGNAILHLSEIDYPVMYNCGITLFWQKRDAPDECKGERRIVRGLNFVRWVKFKPLTPIAVTCLDDVIVSYYLPAPSLSKGLELLRDRIEDKRNKFGFHLTNQQIGEIKQQITKSEGLGNG